MAGTKARFNPVVVLLFVILAGVYGSLLLAQYNIMVANELGNQVVQKIYMKLDAINKTASDQRAEIQLLQTDMNQQLNILGNRTH